jgi:hypothetical protein
MKPGVVSRGFFFLGATLSPDPPKGALAQVVFGFGLRDH